MRALCRSFSKTNLYCLFHQYPSQFSQMHTRTEKWCANPRHSGNRELFQKKQRNLIYEMSVELPVYYLDGESLTPEMVSFSSAG